MNNFKKAIAVCMFAGVAASANAEIIVKSYDFGALAIGNERGFEGTPPTYVIGDLSITATETTVTGTADVSPYLDGKNGAGLEGGLGVCTTLTAAPALQCDPSSDDNVSEGEALYFTFLDDVFDLTITFNNNHDKDPNHNNQPGFHAGDLININGVAWATGTGMYVDYFAGDFAAGDVLEIAYNNTLFYVDAITYSKVPEPSHLVLLALGLAGIAAGRRKA
jgi:hypothetical protein